MRMNIELEGDRRAYEPGEQIAGRVSWILEDPPKEVALRLFWYTEGKGTQDVGIADELSLGPNQEGRESFRLSFPRTPCSFSGRLLSIRWALELVAEPGGETERVDLVMGPEAREIEVHESA